MCPQRMLVIVLNNLYFSFGRCNIGDTLVTACASGKSGLIIRIVFFKIIVIHNTWCACAGAQVSFVCDVWPMLWMYPCPVAAIRGVCFLHTGFICCLSACCCSELLSEGWELSGELPFSRRRLLEIGESDLLLSLCHGCTIILSAGVYREQ